MDILCLRLVGAGSAVSTGCSREHSAVLNSRAMVVGRSRLHPISIVAASCPDDGVEVGFAYDLVVNASAIRRT